jgi:hypothetical protein
MIWKENTQGKLRVGKGEYWYILFGCRFVIPSYVTHAGIYGNDGNCHFHLIVRCQSDIWE